MKAVARTVRNARPHWVGDGFPVRSLFSYHEESDVFDPFLLLDYAGPHEFPPAAGKQPGVGEHPHRGFETVTIVYQGEVAHRDSAGNAGTIGPGDVQWMTAASGVVHEEFHSEKFARTGGPFEMIQLWVNLPSKAKMTAPRYQGIVDADIPRVPLPDGAGTVRVIAGEFAGMHGPAKTSSPVVMYDVQINDGATASLPSPEGYTSAVIVQSGVAKIVNESLKAGELALLERAGHEVSITAAGPTRLLLIAGAPIGEPVVGQGPFVMNTREEIRQAIADYQAGRMGTLS